MSTPTIPAGNLFMNATLYTGNGTSQNITNGAAGASFQPDLVWGKDRTNIANHGLVDSVRGISTWLGSNTTAAENTVASSYVTAFNSNGFTAGLGGVFNASGDNYVAWQWKAGGAAVSNTAGSITSQVSANTTSGFSIVTYTGNGTGGATVGHGLGVAPSMIVFKSRSTTGNWITYHSATGVNAYLYLNSTGAVNSVTPFTALTTTTFALSQTYSDYNTNGTTYVAYCWAPIAGYSAFGSYTGNGSNDGPFVYLGFRPRFLLIKNTTTAGTDWEIWDSARDLYNVESNRLYPDSSAAENGGQNAYDFLSNGFKVRQAGSTDSNQSGATIIYAAFAENPFKYANAR